MKRSFWIIFLFFLDCIIYAQEQSIPPCTTQCTNSQNFFQFRAMSSYSASEIIMIKTLYENDIDSGRPFWQGSFGMLGQFMQNFNDCSLLGCENISSLPFWSGTNSMTYGGNDGKTDVDAYQFGVGDLLGTGTLTMDAQIRQIGADLSLHMVYHKNHPGFYFTIRAPLGSTTVQSILHENIAKHDEIANAQTCAVWLYYPTENNRFMSLGEAFRAGTVLLGTGMNPSNSTLFIDSPLNKPFSLAKGRISENREETIRFADLSLAVGYQFVASEKGFAALGLKFTFPTGNVPIGRYIFEPIFGRAGYWGMGAEFLSHVSLWQHPRRDRGLDFWIKAEALHLFTGRRPTIRSFDLAANGPGSKYMLLQKYHQTLPSMNNPTGNVASYVTQAINLTTIPVISRFAIEGSSAFLLDFHEQNFNIAFSAEVWGRSQESLQLDAYHLLHLDIANLNEFAVLGRQVSSDARSWLLDPTKLILTLDLCEPKARINKSIDRVDGDGIPPAQLTFPTSLPEGVVNAQNYQNRIPADLNKALDIIGAQAPEALTVKLQTQLGYTFKGHKLTPQISAIAGAELVPDKTYHALSQWSAAVQWSINF